MSRIKTQRYARASDAPTVTLSGPNRDDRGKPPSSAAKQRVLGDFVIEREIGRGGMGVVWLAVQRSLGRKVALKALPNFASMDADAVLRFRREAEATGRLTHPGIVPVYGTGESDGIQWFAMEFIDGPTLALLIEQLALRQVEKLRASLVEEAQVADRYPGLREPPQKGSGNAYVRSCARLCADIANALAAAHRAGVIHRDLKPSNILIHPAGRPVLVDFGLARDERQQALTRSGDQIGTPAYMAPEQARGHRHSDARVDVYGLGAVLYELLALRPPYEGSTAAEITHRILTQDLTPVRHRNPNVPVDLAAIVHRCLAKNAEERYPAMEALEHDLRSFLSGRPVHAALPGRMARLQALLQRKGRSLFLGSAAAGVATAIAFLAGLVDDRGDVRHGRELLAQATEQLVAHADGEAARNLYEQASALTKQPNEVREARLRDFRAAFAKHYGDKPRGPRALAAFAQSLPAEEQQALKDLIDRLAGRGTIKLASRSLELQTRELAVRAVDGEVLAAEWRTIEHGSALPVGRYLLRATDTQGLQAHLSVQVDADAATVVSPLYIDPAQLPAEAAVVVDPADGQAVAAAPVEVSVGDFRAWLASLADGACLRELAPRAVAMQDGGDDVAVRGLSFVQARAYARAVGAHLPTMREQWLAGSAGIESLGMPWGGKPEFARLAADPFHLEEAQPIRSRPEGRSPLGIFHVLGNVAEIQSAADGRLRMGGGSFLDDPATLRLYGDRAAVPEQSLLALDQGHPAAGLRLYWFVDPAVGDERVRAAAEHQRAQRREDLRAANEVCLFSDWTLRRDGTIACQVEWNGTYRATDQRVSLPFDTPGFLQQLDRVRVLDGHGRELPRAAMVAAGGERSRLEMAPGEFREGQGYRYAIAAELAPAEGLLPARDGYVLRLPMKRPSKVAQIYTLSLPEGCRVDDVQPAPTSWSVDRRTLVFEQEAGQIETAVVRFRCDGAIGPAALARAPLAERSGQFLAKWNERSGALADWLDPDFVFAPGGMRREQVLRDQPQVQFTASNTGAWVDVSRIGGVETVELRADWQMRDRQRQPFVVPQWPMLLQWRDVGQGPRLVRLQPVTAVDSGRYDGRGGYAHDALRIRIGVVPNAVLSRTQDELTGLQVRIVHPSGLAVQITGLLADVADTNAAIQFRLSGGASILRSGQRVDASGEDAVQEWRFDDAVGLVRERWEYLQRGRRHVLVRCIATGADLRAAEAAIGSDSAKAWFAQVRAALQFD